MKNVQPDLVAATKSAHDAAKQAKTQLDELKKKAKPTAKDKELMENLKKQLKPVQTELDTIRSDKVKFGAGMAQLGIVVKAIYLRESICSI